MKIDKVGHWHGEDGKFVSPGSCSKKESEALVKAHRVYNNVYKDDINQISRREKEVFVSPEEYTVISSEVMRKRAEYIRKNRVLRGIKGVYTANFYYYVRIRKYGFSIIKCIPIEDKKEGLEDWNDITNI